jgi:3-phosphoshikimate 1-carboxyvinyltransferase
MADLTIEPSQLKGSLIIPSSKSHTLRAILFTALADGISRIEHYLPSPDSMSMIQAVRLLGAQVEIESQALKIKGFAGKPQTPDDVIQCGNSGQVLRFIGALAGLIPQYTILTGDASIRHNRPVKPLLDGLRQLGAFALSSRGDDYAPILIRGPFTQKLAKLNGQDSQPVSGLLIAGAFAPYPIEIVVTEPGEKPWIDLTLDWFTKLGIPFQADSYTHYRMNGLAHINGFSYKVPGDFSSAAFPIAAALLTHSPLTLHNIDMDDIQGDKAIIPTLQQMGAIFEIDKKKRTLAIAAEQRLKGIRIDINDFVDALPIMAVIGCFAKGRTEITNAAIARKKESDRIASIACELKKMGASIEEQPDGLIIHESKLHGADLNTYHDHRVALSLTVAALAAQSPSTIHGVECVTKTYPTFYDDLQTLGARIR